MPRDSKTLRKAALALRRLRNESRLDGSHGETMTVTSATTELTCASGASVTWANAIPAGSDVVGVVTRVTTAVGTTNGTTGYQVGDGSDTDLWGDITGVSAGTTSDMSDFTDTSRQIYTSATNIVLTAKTANFDGAGVVRVVVFYITLTPPTR